jgi:predicted ATPase
MAEAAIEWWGKAGQQSLERSALVEAIEQVARALRQIASLPATPALRREEIKLQVALISPLLHVKGFAAPETKAAEERARLLIEQADALGETPEDPLQLFTVLYGVAVANVVALNGDVCRELAAHFLELAEKQNASLPQLIGHNIAGFALMITGDITEGRTHLDQGIPLYDPVEHRPLSTRFGHDQKVVALCHRSRALWLLGYPERAQRDVDQALKDAREILQAATLLVALGFTLMPVLLHGNYVAANSQLNEVVALADEKNAALWRTWGTLHKGSLFALTGDYPGAVQMITFGVTALRARGSLPRGVPKTWLAAYVRLRAHARNTLPLSQHPARAA